MNLEIAGFPPRRADDDIAICAGDEQATFRFDAETDGDSRDTVRVAEVGFGEEVEAVFAVDDLKIDARVVRAKDLHNREQDVAAQLQEAAAIFQIGQFPRLRIFELRKARLDVPYCADASAERDPEELMKTGTVSGLDALIENQAVLFCIAVNLFRFAFFQHHRLFTDDVFPVLQRGLDIAVMRFVGRGDIDRVHVVVKILNIPVRVEIPLLGEFQCADRVRVVDTLHFDAADAARLAHKAARNASRADDADALDAALFRAEHRTGDVLGSLEVDDLAMVFQIVELSFPVGADRENVDMVLLDVAEFLAYGFLDDNLVGEAGFFTFSIRVIRESMTFNLPRALSKLSVVTPTIR